jgi:hypothetical protein
MKGFPMVLPKLLASKDIQERWQMTRQAIHQKRKKDHNFPAPVMWVAGNKIPLFLESEIIEYELNRPWLTDPDYREARIKWIFVNVIANRMDD